MNRIGEDKSDFLRGWLYFIGSVVCLCLCMRTPDGEILFYKFLGLFGVSPGIRLSDNSTLYIFGIIPAIIIIICVRKLFKYWQGYGVKFKNFNIFIRLLPVLVAVIVFIFSVTIINSVYYSSVSRRDGVQAVIYYNDSEIRYEFSGHIRDYIYSLNFENLSDKAVQFKVKFALDSRYDSREMFIIDDNSREAKIFRLEPNQARSYSGSFGELHEDYIIIERGIIPVIILLNDEGEHELKPVNHRLRNRSRNWRVLWGNK